MCYQLLQGQAEIFGTELSLGEQLSLRGQKLAVRAGSDVWVSMQACSCRSMPPACLHACMKTPLSCDMQVYTWLGCTVELAAAEGDVDEVTDVV